MFHAHFTFDLVDVITLMSKHIGDSQNKALDILLEHSEDLIQFYIMRALEAGDDDLNVNKAKSHLDIIRNARSIVEKCDAEKLKIIMGQPPNDDDDKDVKEVRDGMLLVIIHSIYVVAESLKARYIKIKQDKNEIKSDAI